MRTLHSAVAVCVLIFSSLQASGAPLLQYEGSECGGKGAKDYCYVLVSNSPIMEFRVGSTDLDEKHYENVLKPEGWFFAIVEDGLGHAGGACTAIGDVSPGPVKSKTQAKVRWWTEKPEFAVESFTFGFDHPWYAEDVGWGLEGEKDTFVEDWKATVGEGQGPVHGPYSPVPEPGSLAAVCLGATALLARRKAR